MTIYRGDDPFEAAAQADLQPRVYYGQMRIIAQFCILQKGIGKLPFDPQTHRIEDRRTEIKLELTPLPEMNMQRPLLRETLGESVEWVKIILPSIKAIGLDKPLALDNAWVSLKFVPRGDTYIDKNTGEKKDATAMQFVALYPNEDACRAAYEAGGGTPSNGNGHAAAPTDSQPVGNPEQVAAAKFLAVIVKQCKGDVDLIAQKIAQMPLLAKFYTIQSPEVIELVAAEYMATIPVTA